MLTGNHFSSFATYSSLPVPAPDHQKLGSCMKPSVTNTPLQQFTKPWKTFQSPQ